MLQAAYLTAVLLPLLLVLISVGAFASRRMEDGAPHGEPAPVRELHPPRQAPLPSLPEGFRYDAVAPGPLQVVDGEGPTTKVCPDCAETVLHSARVCKHCHFRFDPPLSGSHAV
jgi:hypothetical protein